MFVQLNLLIYISSENSVHLRILIFWLMILNYSRDRDNVTCNVNVNSRCIFRIEVSKLCSSYSRATVSNWITCVVRGE